MLRLTVLTVLSIICNGAKPQAVDGGTLSKAGERTCALVADSANVYPYYEVDEQPQFIGGEAKYFEYMSKHFKYPTCMEMPNSTIHVSFTVDRNGNIQDSHVTSATPSVMASEVLRVINGMPPWKPGICAGTKVPVTMTVPIRVCLR
ncbi:MAG: energy transducer TonB [Flavobacteriales bacterium]|nr:energy transducer TonB [Flavobacteriales bacterium]